jgi:hypothetical protein
MKTHTTTFTVQLELAPANGINKLAEGHLAFKGGPLDGCTLGGFTVWENRTGTGQNVTFPGRPYTDAKGDKKTFSFIHGESAGMSHLRSVVLKAYREAKLAAATDV